MGFFRLSIVVLLLAVSVAQADDRAKLEQLAEEFDSGTHLRVSPHYLLVYDTPNAWADSRVTLLERAHDAFYKAMRRGGFDPEPLDERLVGVLFDDHEDYLAYGKQRDRLDVSTAGGYYSPRTNRITMYNTSSSPKLTDKHRKLAALQQQVDKAGRLADEAGRVGNTQQAAHYRRVRARALNQLTMLQNRLHRAAGLNNIAQTIHEAAHQLSFNSGVQNRFRLNPFWLSEGLATSFETHTPAVPFGPGEDNPMRRRKLLDAVKAGQIMPLGKFVTRLTAADVDEDTRNRLYAQAWGLFSFLYETQRDALRQYMQRIKTGQTSKTSDGLLDDFEQAFGPIDRITPAWQTWLNQLR